MTKPNISVADARAIGKKLAADGVAVFVFRGDQLQIATYGATRDKYRQMGKWNEHLYDEIADGGLPHPFWDMMP